MKNQFSVSRGASQKQLPAYSATNQASALAPPRPRLAALSLRPVAITLLILSSLTRNAAGVIPLGGMVTTSGDQIYNEPVVLTSDTTLVSTGGGNMVFNSTVDGMQSLVVATAGAIAFNGAVGGTAALMNLTTDAGSTLLNGGTVATLGSQTYNRAVVLGGNLTMASSGAGTIVFNSTVA